MQVISENSMPSIYMMNTKVKEYFITYGYKI